MTHTLKNEIDQAIKMGDQRKVLKYFRQLNLKKIKRADAYDFAKFARRIRCFTLALKILNPYIRPKTIVHEPATPAEIIEYAASIRGLGSPSEALELLKPINPEHHPEAFLEKAFNYFSQWNDALAIPELESYLEYTNPNDYSYLVGMINLANGYIGNEQFDAAETLLLEIAKKTHTKNSAQLYLNSQEMLAQIDIHHSQNPTQAIQRLKQTLSKYQFDSSNIGYLFAEKWLAIAESIKSGKISTCFDNVRKKSLQFKHWETWRDLDFYQAIIEKDKHRLNSLYFGTPFFSYRRKIMYHLNESDLPSHWIRNLRSATGFLDLESGKNNLRKVILPPGTVLHKLMVLLNQDFYQKIPTLSVFAKLYPGEFFCPDTSINRVHQNIRRLRLFFRNQNIPFILKEFEGSYYLEVIGSYGVRVPQEQIKTDKTIIQIRKIRDSIKGHQFRTQEACQILEMSRSNVQRLLSRACDQKLVDKVERGRLSFYKLKNVA